MILKLYRRIVLLLVLVVAPLVVYVVRNARSGHPGLQFIDSLSHLPLHQEIPSPAPLALLDECTIVNPLSRGFVDLRGLSAAGNDGRPQGFGAKGYDSGVNFTLGICSSPMKRLHESSEIKDGVNSSTIGGYYKDPKTGLYVSIGEYNSVPLFRGRKLTLTYENGSFCNIKDDAGKRLKKSTVITLVCDREMQSKAAVSYIGNTNDCTYMFEVRLHHVCPTAAKGNNLNAAWIFVFIVAATVLGGFSGNILYKQLKGQRRPPVKL